MKQILLSIFVLLITLQSFGQTAQCTKRLTDAEEAFDQGRLQDVLSLLNKDDRDARNCFANFTIDERIRAEKLLTKTFIFTDNPDRAEDALVDLLIVDKEHQLAKNDPSELHFLYSQFKTEPIFRVGFRLGANLSSIKVLQAFDNTQLRKAYNPSFGQGIGFSFEALVERHIKNGIEVGLGAQYRIASYQFESSFIPGDENRLLFQGINRSTMLRIPLLGRYNFNYDKKDEDGVRLKLMPYVFGGVSYDLTISAKYVDTDRTGGTAFTLNENLDLVEFDQVANSNISLFAGVGVKLRTGRAKVDFLTFELRYDNSLFNYINPDNRWANKDLNINVGFVEDDLTINTVSVSVGYTKSFYRPRKRKQYR